MNNSKLHEAFDEEAKDIDVNSLMEEMLNSFNQEQGYTPSPLDEFKIRKLILARKYREKEQERLVLLKNAIMQEWDQRIAKEGENIQQINDIIEKYIKEHNQGKKLSLDVGTATLRRSAPKTKVIDKDKAREFLRDTGELEAFLKAPELDTTLLQNSYINKFKQQVEEETAKRIQQEIADSVKGKITKKREGEIKLQVEQELADAFFKDLPEFLEYVPETQKLSITMK